jgi:hypothetical protein
MVHVRQEKKEMQIVISFIICEQLQLRAISNQHLVKLNNNKREKKKSKRILYKNLAATSFRIPYHRMRKEK